MGYAKFPKELWRPPSLAQKTYTDIRRWSVMQKGGHVAALEQPEALARNPIVVLQPAPVSRGSFMRDDLAVRRPCANTSATSASPIGSRERLRRVLEANEGERDDAEHQAPPHVPPARGDGVATAA
jgi:hypothetical protein